jgi:NAD(P)-dependent dehydrogenase (short-subunit alcohol dehydrogenase family)
MTVTAGAVSRYNASMTQPVLVTGASSGIGLVTAKLLAERGVHVFATVRSAVDAERLAGIERLEPIVGDVRVDADVAGMRAAILERGHGLWGLVNNAGVGAAGHLTAASALDIHELFDVNVYGVHRVTNAVVDLLIASGGRIVTMSSIWGTVAGPESGIYAMSKHALEAYTDCLAAQLRERGVHVCAVVPGNFQSALVEKMVKRVPRPEGASEWLSRLYEPGADTSRSEYLPPDDVASACYHALFDPLPHRRYLITPDANESVATLKKAAMEMLQLNRACSHALTHEQLHALLDEMKGLMEEHEAKARAVAGDAGAAATA